MMAHKFHLVKRFAFFLFLFWIFYPEGMAFSKNYIQKTRWGNIDWSNGVMEVTVISFPPSGITDPARARALTMNLALKKGQSKILNLLEEIPINSQITVGRLINKDKVALKNVIRELKKSWIKYVEFMTDGSLKLILSVRLRGALMDAILPDYIKDVNVIHKCVNKGAGKREEITGLVVDCRGLKLKPSLVPVIYNEQGEEIYGPSTVSRGYVTQKGMVEYIHGFNDEQIRGRAGSNATEVLGTKIKKDDPFSIIISNEDALRIKSLPESALFFNNCNVVICID